MKKYLMRAPSGCFDNPSHFDCISKNLIGDNSGNLLFPHSISRALMCEDVQIDYIKTSSMLDDAKISDLNREYEAFIIPLANAFRISFINELTALTYLVSRLSIPCVVIGVGVNGVIKADDKGEYPFDAASRHFVNAVLKKSDCIGIRGEQTAAYLEHLGFVRDKDFMVIGCPSMFLYGADLPKPRKFTLDEHTKVSINSKAVLPEKLHLFLNDVCQKMPDHYYVPQNVYEFKTLFSGISIKDTQKNMKVYKDYPQDLEHPLYRENKVRGFVSAEAWFEYLRGRDLSVGSRIHGNIAAVISGTPAFIIAPDNRVLELAEYHNLPHTTIDELPADADIFSLIKGVDFDQILEGHQERFEKYHEFFKRNKLATIYDDPNYSKDTVTPFDKKIASIDFKGPLVPLPFADYDTQVEGIRYLRRQWKNAEKKKSAPEKKTAKDRLKSIAKKILKPKK